MTKKHLNFRQDLYYSLKIYILSTLLLILYILVVYVAGNLFFKEKAAGSLIYDDEGNIRGSLLVSQEFTHDKYFHSRIYDEFESNCDIALYNKNFKDAINARHSLRTDLRDISIITPSNSLKDPYIMAHDAFSQVERVAQARNMEIVDVIEIIEAYRTPPYLPFFALDIVNIVKLNARLDGYI